LQAVLANRFILLGETHDNPVHHRHQAWIIQQLAEHGRTVGVAFEMISQSQYEIITKHTLHSASEVFDVLNWEQTGWPERKLYEPVFSAALQAHYKLFPANIARDRLNSIIKGDNESIPKDIAQRLEDNPLPPDMDAALRKEIDESHCHMLPEDMVHAMMMGQRVRDAVMADSLLKYQQADGIVFIGGSGHAQNRGVPYYIKAEKPDAKVFNIAWMEVDKQLTTAKAYRDYWGIDELPFDYVWFTARIDRPDPCEELKKHHKFKQSSQAGD
jgi:uncharacterized iron-regulated protein